VVRVIREHEASGHTAYLCFAEQPEAFRRVVNAFLDEAESA
jgi:hypothetical protein